MESRRPSRRLPDRHANPYTLAVTSPPSSTLSPTAPALVGREADSRPPAGDETPWIGWIRETHGASEAPSATPAPPPAEFFWESPEGEALYASGEAARLECDGSGRFAEARSWLQALRALARFEGELPEDGLVAFARFSFEDDGSPGGASAPGTLFVPSRLLVRRPGERDRRYEWEPARAETSPRGRAEGAGRPPAEEPPRSDWSREGWDRAVGQVLARIGAGDLEKVVLARTRLLQAEGCWDPEALFLRLRREYPSCYRFLCRDPGGATLVGASPERLVSLRGGLVKTDAVAGTSRADGDADGRAGTDLLANAKETREHAVVAREIAAALREAGAEVEPFPAPSVFRLQRLIHLRAQVTATAPSGVGILDLVERLHPTPAVAGTPRAAALEAIGRLEPRRRGWYAGPIGWACAAGEGDFTVGLRTAWLQGGRALLFAGAGIVAGSDAGREWEECDSKMDVIQEALAEEALERGVPT